VLPAAPGGGGAGLCPAGADTGQGRENVIARLRGTPVARTADGLVLDVAGVGYLLRLSERAYRKAKESREVTFETYLHVREDVLQLYGFAEPAERELFEQLLSVSGVGPKVALLIVSGSSPAELRRSIVLGDTTRFLAIPGVGKKTAEQVVPEGAPDLVARDALVELGYSAVEAERALAGTDPEAPPEERVRQALKAA
jgi:Holliday junction DNA helicase RuvA